MKMSSMPPLHFLLFCLLCCSSSFNETQTEMFSVWEEDQGRIEHNAYACCTNVFFFFCQNFGLYLKVGFEFFCHFSCFYSLYISLWSCILGFQRPAWHWQKHLISMCGSTSCQLTWWTKSQTGLDTHRGMLIHAKMCQGKFLNYFLEFFFLLLFLIESVKK